MYIKLHSIYVKSTDCTCQGQREHYLHAWAAEPQFKLWKQYQTTEILVLWQP